MARIDLLFQQFFSLKNFASLYNFITMPNPTGYLIFPGLIAVTIYYWEAEKHKLSLHPSHSLMAKGGDIHPPNERALYVFFSLIC